MMNTCVRSKSDDAYERSRIQRIVAVEEKTGAKSAAFVESVRVRVRSVDLQSVAHFLGDAQLQGVVEWKCLPPSTGRRSG